MLDPMKPSILRNRIPLVVLLAVATLLGGCLSSGPSDQGGIGRAVSWSKLPGWQQDHPAQAWPALLSECKVMPQRDPRWTDICADAHLLGTPDDEIARAFFETRFVPHVVRNDDGTREGMVTGYYEPLLQGSRVRTSVYRYPVYARPKNLLVVDLGSLYDDLKGLRLRGRLVDGDRVVPYFSREQIEDGKGDVEAKEIAWVKDPIGLFFLHIQGSGRIQLRDGTTLAVNYADQNGHPYVAIGRYLIDKGYIKKEDLSMQSIRQWLETNPDQAEDLMMTNPSYVFFTAHPADGDGPPGSLHVPLTAERSIAVDPGYIPLGSPVWVDTTLPADPGDKEGTPEKYQRLTFAQDTGGAISGAVRADLFWGMGARAEDYAGRMRQPGELYVLVPAQRTLNEPAAPPAAAPSTATPTVPPSATTVQADADASRQADPPNESP
jgi:membrane-bound lytic murein transglycosylase A